MILIERSTLKYNSESLLNRTYGELYNIDKATCEFNNFATKELVAFVRLR